MKFPRLLLNFLPLKTPSVDNNVTQQQPIDETPAGKEYIVWKLNEWAQNQHQCYHNNQQHIWTVSQMLNANELHESVNDRPVPASSAPAATALASLPAASPLATAPSSLAAALAPAPLVSLLLPLLLQASLLLSFLRPLLLPLLLPHLSLLLPLLHLPFPLCLPLIHQFLQRKGACFYVLVRSDQELKLQYLPEWTELNFQDISGAVYHTSIAIDKKCALTYSFQCLIR